MFESFLQYWSWPFRPPQGWHPDWWKSGAWAFIGLNLFFPSGILMMPLLAFGVKNHFVLYFV
jgi:hypothetical protein